MGKLELLWNLESYNVELDKLLKDLNKTAKQLKEHEMEEELKNIGASLERLENNRVIIKESILKYENSLGQCQFEVETLNHKLYKENIVDIKQLEYLSREKEDMEAKIEKIEEEMLAYMEEEEIIEKKYDANLLKIEEIKKGSQEKSSVFRIEIKSLEEKIKEIEDSREVIVGKIDKDILQQYKIIRKRKVKPIVLVKEKTCSGCNMMLPLYQLEDIRAKNKIINCESCGRILYLRD